MLPAMAGPRRLVLSDTSWPGYEEVPGWVIEGYATIFHEIDESDLPSGEALAAELTRFLRERDRQNDPPDAATEQ